VSDTLLFSGTDLATVCTVQDLDEFWSSSDQRGDLPAFPGVDGVESGYRPVSAKVASGQVAIIGSSRADVHDGIAATKALLQVGRPQVLTRRKVTGAGNLDATQTAIVRNVDERRLGDRGVALILAVELLDGVWYGSALTISSAAGTQSIAGDVRTRRMTLTLAAGAARTIENTTNGHKFTFGTTVPSGGVLVDVEARTATALTGGADMSAYLSWTKFFPFQLEPGSNVLTVSAGSASISYQPAYQ
jgi:hypothetical protein